MEVLQQHLPAQGAALEIASGTGQHVVWFAHQMPTWTWLPTEVHQGALYNIAARVAQADLPNVFAPETLDVCTLPWFAHDAAPPRFDLIFCANMLHIAPWEACTSLMQGAARHLEPGGVLVTYGPYFENEVVAAPSNVEFDHSLRAHDIRWGIRQREAVEQAAAHAGLCLRARHTMPSNNLALVWAY